MHGIPGNVDLFAIAHHSTAPHQAGEDPCSGHLVEEQGEVEGHSLVPGEDVVVHLVEVRAYLEVEGVHQGGDGGDSIDQACNLDREGESGAPKWQGDARQVGGHSFHSDEAEGVAGDEEGTYRSVAGEAEAQV